MHTREDIINALTTLGNGDFDCGKSLLVALADRLTHARTKHPVFASGSHSAICVILEEVKEMVHAFIDETPERVTDEALDVLATSVRFYNGEQE